ncbi:hypothetical protein CQ051_21660, partial [Ochrobactrum sp. MYb14]
FFALSDAKPLRTFAGNALGFKPQTAASITLSGIELIHMMRKQQGIFPAAAALSIKQQFEVLTG